MPNVAVYMLQRLQEWGIHRIYGFPGDGINGFLGAFEEVGEDPFFTQTRHEEMAAFMACAHAKFTGEIGACIATSGPGAVHLANGLYDAKLDHQPVLAIVGQQKRQSVGAHYQQEIDLQSFFKDIGGFVSTVMDQHSARHVLDRAIKSALTERRPAVVIVPDDVAESEYAEPPRMHGSVFSSVGWIQPHMVPDGDLLRQAADVLNQGQKVAMLIGQGAAKARDEVLQVADLLGAGIAKALDRKSTRLNSSHPSISYAVFCLKKKKKPNISRYTQYIDKIHAYTHSLLSSFDFPAPPLPPTARTTYTAQQLLTPPTYPLPPPLC